MLRFDLPRLWSNVSRWEAFLNFAFCAAALAVSPWLLVVPLVQGALRGFAGHRHCPLHRAWDRVFVARGIAGRAEDAGPKMFANKILFVACAVSLALFAAGSGLWRVPCAVVVGFAFLEWTVGFCAACWVYGAWYRRFPPSRA